MEILKQLLEDNKNILSKNDYNNISHMLREYEINNNIIIHNTKTKSCNNLYLFFIYFMVCYTFFYITYTL